MILYTTRSSKQQILKKLKEAANYKRRESTQILKKKITKNSRRSMHSLKIEGALTLEHFPGHKFFLGHKIDDRSSPGIDVTTAGRSVLNFQRY